MVLSTDRVLFSHHTKIWIKLQCLNNSKSLLLIYEIAIVECAKESKLTSRVSSLLVEISARDNINS